MHDPYPYAFEALVTSHDVGKGAKVLTYTVVFLPNDIADRLPFDRHPRLRIEGEFNEQPISGAWQPSGDGRWFFMLSKPLLRAAGVTVGDKARLHFGIVDQDAVELHHGVSALLETDAKARKTWDQLTPGKQRGLNQRVAAAKTAPTREKRLDELRAALHDPTADSPLKRVIGKI